LKRVVVRLDKLTCYLDCACCTRKLNCNLKKLALWYLAQECPQLLQSTDASLNDNSSDILLDSNQPSDAAVPELDSEHTRSQSSVQECLNVYLRQRYRIPPDLEAILVSDSISSIEPPESQCPICSGSLSCSLLTKHGKMYDVDRCISGWFFRLCLTAM
jgi:hypothetical protein